MTASNDTQVAVTTC